MLKQHHLQLTKDILAQHLDLNQYRPFIFGSWAKNTHRPYSDMDIGLEGPQPIPNDTMFKIKNAFEDSDLPYFVDVVDFATVSDQFKQVAKQHTIPLN